MSGDDDWRELCYLWSSDFRTHITEKRWAAYRRRLRKFEERAGVDGGRPGFSKLPKSRGPLPPGVKAEHNGRYLMIETDTVKISLNSHRGLAIDRLWLKGVSERWLVGTLHHGYYDDIAMGADFYTGHLVLETLDQPKITDLGPTEATIAPLENGGLLIRGEVASPLGLINKTISINADGSIGLEYELDWEEIPLGALRLGHVTINPEAFDVSQLYYETHNGGFYPERFALAGCRIEQGRSVSFLVSASSALGMTEGSVSIGDRDKMLSVLVDKAAACVVAQVTYLPVGESYFCRVSFSAAEMDDTTRTSTRRESPRRYVMKLCARSAGKDEARNRDSIEADAMIEVGEIIQ